MIPRLSLAASLLCAIPAVAAEEFAPDAPAESAGVEPAPEAGSRVRPAQGRSASGFDVALDGRVRVGFSTFTPKRFFGIRMPMADQARRNPDVGRFDGFGLSDARLNLRATYGDNLYVRIGFDGAVVTYRDAVDPVGRHSTGVKDAYLRHNFDRRLVLYAGRFKPPFDIEELTPTEEQLFVHRALESRGVQRHEGFYGDMPGMAPGRQLGLMLGSDALADIGPLSLGYALAVTNGNSGEASLNDNDLPAVWGRLHAAWGGTRAAATSATGCTDEEGPATYALRSGGLVGVSGFYNEASFGEARNRTRDRIVGAGLDAAATVWLVTVQGQLLWTQTEHMLLTGGKTENAVGGHGAVALRLWGTGFTVAYRVAVYNPRWVAASDGLEDTADYDQVAHHSVALRYRPEQLPLVLVTDFTHSVEQPGRALPNDRVEAALQVTF